jgi:hypothetical protein
MMTTTMTITAIKMILLIKMSITMMKILMIIKMMMMTTMIMMIMMMMMMMMMKTTTMMTMMMMKTTTMIILMMMMMMTTIMTTTTTTVIKTRKTTTMTTMMTTYPHASVGGGGGLRVTRPEPLVDAHGEDKNDGQQRHHPANHLRPHGVQLACILHALVLEPVEAQQKLVTEKQSWLLEHTKMCIGNKIVLVAYSMCWYWNQLKHWNQNK